MTAPPPDAASLHEAALNYLARYAATELGVQRILQRRVDRWARDAARKGADREVVAMQAATARSLVRDVVTQLVEAGALNDVAFAENRSRTLVRAGRSRRAVVAYLAAKGVNSEAARAIVPDNAETELAAALVLARRRRIGPFRAGAQPDETGRRRELSILARAGFPQSTASQALAMATDDAEAVVNRLRR
jgi:regulatory protein